MKYIKTYEGVFYSKELLVAMFELMRKCFYNKKIDINYEWMISGNNKKFGISFKSKKFILNFSYITINKKKEFIEINFNNNEDLIDLEFVFNDIIDKLCEITTLKNKEIGNRYDCIIFPIYDYNKVINFIKNYSTDDIEAYFDAKNFNL